MTSVAFSFCDYSSSYLTTVVLLIMTYSPSIRPQLTTQYTGWMQQVHFGMDVEVKGLYVIIKFEWQAITAGGWSPHRQLVAGISRSGELELRVFC